MGIDERREIRQKAENGLDKQQRGLRAQEEEEQQRAQDQDQVLQLREQNQERG